jgi:hypothetical protein
MKRWLAARAAQQAVRWSLGAPLPRVVTLVETCQAAMRRREDRPKQAVQPRVALLVVRLLEALPAAVRRRVVPQAVDPWPSRCGSLAVMPRLAPSTSRCPNRFG